MVVLLRMWEMDGLLNVIIGVIRNVDELRDGDDGDGDEELVKKGDWEFSERWGWI